MPPVWKVRCSGQLVRRTDAASEVSSTLIDEVPEIHLPVGVVTRILEKLGGDVTSLCAAACVSSTWHAASKTSSVWRIISVGVLRQARAPSPLALRMDGEVLARLVGLAGPSLTFLEISGAVNLCDADLLCLRRPACPSLSYVSIMGVTPIQTQMAITARGVLEALKGRKLKSLEVKGIKSGRGLEADGPALINELRGLVRKPEQLDAQCVCQDCGRLITEAMVARCINDCPETWCAFCAGELEHVIYGFLCEDCAIMGVMGRDEDGEEGSDEDGFPF